VIIVVGGIKGGAGKITTAANLAARRAADGYDVLLVDGDDQETTTLWSATRQEHYPDGTKHLTCVQLRGKAARSEVLKLAPR
jgi:chromosome partitioning protein